MADTMPKQPMKLQHDRQREIRRLALEFGSVEVTELAKWMGVTAETIRRDLSDLQAAGELRRVHGGAVPVERAVHEPTLTARDARFIAEKLRIAEVAAEEVPEGGTVLIDSGSTLLRLAEVFPSERPAHVITNSIVGAVTLIHRGVSRVTVLGGDVRVNTMAMVDAVTTDMVRGMLVDVLFISCDGLSLDRGLTTPYRDEHALKRAMIEASKRVIALVDHSKLGNGQLYPYADFDEIDMLIIDDGADDETIERLRETGIDLRIATS